MDEVVPLPGAGQELAGLVHLVRGLGGGHARLGAMDPCFVLLQAFFGFADGRQERPWNPVGATTAAACPRLRLCAHSGTASTIRAAGGTRSSSCFRSPPP